MKLLSVVLPAYNEEQMIEETWKTLERILKKAEIPFELVFASPAISAKRRRLLPDWPMQKERLWR